MESGSSAPLGTDPPEDMGEQTRLYEQNVNDRAQYEAAQKMAEAEQRALDESIHSCQSYDVPPNSASDGTPCTSLGHPLGLEGVQSFCSEVLPNHVPLRRSDYASIPKPVAWVNSGQPYWDSLMCAEPNKRIVVVAGDNQNSPIWRYLEADCGRRTALQSHDKHDVLRNNGNDLGVIIKSDWILDQIMSWKGRGQHEGRERPLKAAACLARWGGKSKRDNNNGTSRDIPRGRRRGSLVGLDFAGFARTPRGPC